MYVCMYVCMYMCVCAHVCAYIQKLLASEKYFQVKISNLKHKLKFFIKKFVGISNGKAHRNIHRNATFFIDRNTSVAFSVGIHQRNPSDKAFPDGLSSSHFPSKMLFFDGISTKPCRKILWCMQSIDPQLQLHILRAIVTLWWGILRWRVM